ncbi:MAG: hypothetical protein FD163_2250 [Hyphomonadaceae bacterium]|nr:MAG: hypothetical protein FD128_714 [Hyphomonadaceae bacterium]KAF0183530.1 MAG: hypothetical protein FD163_2250 [Hyphomonadaceae bacterium]
MTNLLVRDIDENLVVRLKNKAKARGTSMQAVLKEAVENAATDSDNSAVWDELRTFRNSIPPMGISSMELLKEGRDYLDWKTDQILNGWKDNK